MKTVTNNFLTAQRKVDTKIARAIYYKRRYWDQSTRAYVWESTWTILDSDLFVSVTPVTWNLDTDILNSFKVANVTVVLNNSDGRFFFDNPDGFFGQDEVSPNHPYEPYWTKFQVRAGFILPDGSEEKINLFTGVAAENWVFDSEMKTVQITAQGLEALLINTKASDMGTVVTRENIGTGDGSTVDFTTDNPGVGAVTEVSINGVTAIDGFDYQVSQTNDATLGAKITFTNPPDVADVLKATYYYWPQALQFHEIVSELLDAAGIDASHQDLEPVAFENSVINNRNFTTAADWDTGVKTGLTSTLVPGDLVPDFSGSEFETVTNWTTSLTGWTSANFATDGVKLTPTNRHAYLYRALQRAQGVWKFTFKNSLSEYEFYFGFMASNLNVHATDALFFDGYAIQVFTSSFDSITEIRLFRTIQLSGKILGTYDFTSDTAEYAVKVVRDANGRFMVYLNGNLIIDVTDTSFDHGDYLLISEIDPSTPATPFSIKLVSVPPASTLVRWQSPTIDAAVTPTAWEPLEISQESDGATILYETESSSDDVSYDSWVAISGQNIPQSTLRRYLKIRFSFTLSNLTLTYYPSVHFILIIWITTSTTITLPAFTDSDVYEAIQKIGEFTNYEYGFTAEEIFFFRPKSVGSSLIDLSENNFVSKINSMTGGYENMYGTVRATYGNVVREATDNGDFAESPNARISDRIFEISPDSNIQIPASADVATGIAQGLFAYLSKRRRRFKALCKFLPQLELSDVITISLINNTPTKLWYAGDNDVDAGDTDVYCWGDKQQIVFNTPAKIVGIRYDAQQGNTELDLEEVV